MISRGYRILSVKLEDTDSIVGRATSLHVTQLSLFRLYQKFLRLREPTP